MDLCSCIGKPTIEVTPDLQSDGSFISTNPKNETEKDQSNEVVQMECDGRITAELQMNPTIKVYMESHGNLPAV